MTATTDDFSARVALLDMPRIPPLPANRPYSLLGECLQAVSQCDTLETLQALAATYNTSVSAFAALSDADKATVRVAWRDRRAVVNLGAAWSRIWGFLANADLPAPIPQRPTAATIEDDLRRIAAEIPTLPPSTNARAMRAARARATRIVNNLIGTIAEGNLIRASITSEDGASLRHGRAIVGHLTTRKDLIACLAAIGMADLAPKVPSAVRHLGEAMKKLNNNQLIARNPDDKPDHVDSRWFAGSLDLAMETDSLGSRDLTVDLVDGVITFSPADHPLVPTVRDAYERRIAGETYNTTTLIQWLRDTLKRSFFGRDWYDSVFVPASQKDRATRFVAALDASGVMGRDVMLRTETTDEGLRKGLLRSFEAEIDAVEAEIDAGSRGAESLLGDLFRAQKAVDGFSVLLGEDHTATVNAKIKRLHEICASRLDDTRQRFAAMDLD